MPSSRLILTWSFGRPKPSAPPLMSQAYGGLRSDVAGCVGPEMQVSWPVQPNVARRSISTRTYVATSKLSSCLDTSKSKRQHLSWSLPHTMFDSSDHESIRGIRRSGTVQSGFSGSSQSSQSITDTWSISDRDNKRSSDVV